MRDAEDDMRGRQPSLFDDQRLNLDNAIDLSLTSLREYGSRYRHWCIAYSGGKDSTATATFVVWAIKTGKFSALDSLTILYADTRQELPPLQQSAMKLLETLRAEGFRAEAVLPEMDKRFFVYILGRGVPPPNNNTFRWCTRQIKVEPMHSALSILREQIGEKLLMITGVRLGESAVRDQKIALSCSKNSGECGQGWFQVATNDALADTLAPLLHWRLCHVFDWLYFDEYGHGYDVSGIATVYGEEEARTGCVGCPLAHHDTALERVVRLPEWSHLEPLLQLKSIYRELRQPQNRLRKSKPEPLKDGSLSKSGQRMGPLTPEARLDALERILAIQQQAGVDFINPEEEARIRELIADNTWPQKWDGSEVRADELIPLISVTDNGKIVTQDLLVR